VEWATTMNNLAFAYSKLPSGDRETNLRQAIEHCQAALRVRTADSFPFDCLQTLHILGELYFSDKAWGQALESYTQAVTVAEQIREAALQESERHRVLAESSVVFERAVLSAVRTTQYSLALALTERGKTRNLADHLWQREVKPQGVSESEWQKYQWRLSAARGLERQLSTTPLVEADSQSRRERGSPRSVRSDIEKLIDYRIAITETENRFRQADPGYLPFASPLEIKDITGLAAIANAVIIEFRVTHEGTYVFLVGPEDQEVTPDQVIEIQDFIDEALWQMLVQFEGNTPAAGWLVKYELYRDRPRDWLDEWLACVERTTGEVYKRLFAQVHERLRQRYPKARRLILVPNKGLNLLPLHACWWENETGQRRYLLDDYEIAYTPSCQVLKHCLAREQANGAPAHSLFAVQNPDGSLPFSDWEVEEVCKFFPAEQQRILAGAQATAEAVKEHVSFGEEKLFSCHGLFDLTEVEKSRLVLYEDGSLTVRDVVPMDLSGTWLAVMSACETGLTDHRDIIDEYQGQPAAFLVAGAQTVVPSLWAVTDFSTALLMQRFHTNMYENKVDKASSLGEAQCWLRDLNLKEAETILHPKLDQFILEGKIQATEAVGIKFLLRERAKASQGRPFANPHWWAAFQCVGAGWKVSDSLKEQ